MMFFPSGDQLLGSTDCGTSSRRRSAPPPAADRWYSANGLPAPLGDAKTISRPSGDQIGVVFTKRPAVTVVKMFRSRSSTETSGFVVRSGGIRETATRLPLGEIVGLPAGP